MDFSGYRRDGTLTNMDPSSDWVASGNGVALDFDGVNDYVTCRITVTYPLTISIWALSRTTTARSIIEVSPQSANDGWGVQVNNTTALAYGATNGVASTGVAIRQSEWNHYAYTCTSSTSRLLYVNCISGVVETTNRTPAAITTVLFAASYNYGAYSSASCQIDDVRIYGRVITSAEIKLLSTRRAIAYENKRKRVGRLASSVTRNRNYAWCPV
jgi:hypothetical protein